MTKPLLQVLAGKPLSPPPVWIMRQAGRYLPEYRATRKKAGDFLSLCYNSDLATEVTLQPIRRFGFDASILFADILLLPQALGSELWFVQGEGPRLSTITTPADIAALRPTCDIHETLAPIYQTLRNLRTALPPAVTLIGFAGAPWTVASYMIAGRGTPNQAPARMLMNKMPGLFDQLMARLEEATIEYLCAQIDAGAEVIKLFDSWAGALWGPNFEQYIRQPTYRIVTALKAHAPHVPVIAFPRGAGRAYSGFAKATGADCVALDHMLDPKWAADFVQRDGCVQGNLTPRALIEGGSFLQSEVKRLKDIFSNGPHIFNLGHGITPDANPNHVMEMIDAIRTVPA